MKKLLFLAAIILFLTDSSFGAFSKSDAGTTTASFLKLGAGARSAGLGDAFCSVADDSTAIFWNPAGLSRIQGTSFSFMHALWFENISYDWISFAGPTKFGTFGGAVQYLSYGAIKKTDSTGTEISDFTPSDLALSLSYGKNFSGVLLGTTIKYISSRIEQTATAYAFDAGAKILLGYEDKFALGLCVQNFGTTMKFEETEEALPFSIKAGCSYKVNDEWLLALDLNSAIDNDPFFCLGSEYTTEITNDARLSARAGYNPRTQNIPGFTNFTFGLGVDYGGYIFDYAFVPLGDMGTAHKFSFSIKFGKNYEDYAKEPPHEKEKVVNKIRKTIVITELKGEDVTAQLIKFATFSLKNEIFESNFFDVKDIEDAEQKKNESQFKGMVEEQKGVQIGRRFNTGYVLIGNIKYSVGYYFLTVQLIDVQESRIVKTIYEKASSIDDIQNCCKKISKKLKL
ncbi:MAG: PorV/PorQ family protein [Elusimicrobia bacterium]|nr:PorV/PorQ family protein [Elusimicrobiota bacterium]